VLDEYLRQLVDPVLNEHVAGAGKRRRAMRHIVDRRPHDGRAFFRQHARDCSRRSELAGETLHENCPNLRRFHAVRQTIDGFGFQTCPTAHVSPIEERRQMSRSTPLLWHNVSQPMRENREKSNQLDRRLQNGCAKIHRQT
jgi:hypothetical protein